MGKIELLSGLRESYLSSTTPAYIDRLCVSWLLPVWWFFALRTLLAAYMIVFESVYLACNAIHGQNDKAIHHLAYFSALANLGLAFYYAFSATHTASYAIRGRSYLSEWPASLRWMHSVLYATITVFPIIVTVLFWTGLAVGVFDVKWTPFTVWSNISGHVLNTVMCLLEILLPMSLEHPWINLIPLIVISICYIGLSYVVHAFAGFYTYEFLDPIHGIGLVVGCCLGLIVVTTAAFIAVRSLIQVRIWATQDKKTVVKSPPWTKDRCVGKELPSLAGQGPQEDIRSEVVAVTGENK